MTRQQIRRTIFATAGTVALAVTSSAAMAHGGAGEVHPHAQDAWSSFMEGALHPFTGLDHLAAMLGVGLWSALSMRSLRQRLAAPLAFATLLLVGAMLGMSGLNLAGVEPMIAASLLAIGLLLATRLALRPAVGASVVAAFALFHGAAHGLELGGQAGWALAGMVCGTAALHGIGLATGMAVQRGAPIWHTWLPRIAGAAMAALGLTLVTPALAGMLA